MGKSFKNNDFYDDYDYDYEDKGYRGSNKKSDRKNDKKMQIQQARKKAQAERDRAIKAFTDSSED